MRSHVRMLPWLTALAVGCGGSGPPPLCTEAGASCNDGLCSNGADDGVCDAQLECQTSPSTSGTCVVFLTSDEHGADLGGLEGADAICQRRAREAGLEGTFRAWLSDSTTAAAERLTHSAVPYVDTRGQGIADDWSDLSDGSLQRPITVDENAYDWDADAAHCGITAYLSRVWTATATDGSALGPFCDDWTSTGDEFVVAGFYCDASGTWTDSGLSGSTVGCGAKLSLYCLQQ